MSTGYKLLFAWLLLIGSALLLRVSGWFGVGFVVALPLVILLWFDFGRELRTLPSTGRAGRVAGLLMGVPQALFGMVSAIAGVAIVLWVLYNSLWKRDPAYTGGFMTFGMGPLLALFGVGMVLDAFSRPSTLSNTAAEASPQPAPSNAGGAKVEPWCLGTWEIISYGWTEIGIEQKECDDLVQKYGITKERWREVRRTCFRDVCASFAFEAFLILPLMLWMLMPDWGFEESWLRKRVERWYARPYAAHFLNPLRILGYPMALVLATKYFLMMRRSVFPQGSSR